MTASLLISVHLNWYHEKPLNSITKRIFQFMNYESASWETVYFQFYNKFWSFWVYFPVSTHWENKSPIEKIFLRFWILSDHVTYIMNYIIIYINNKKISKRAMAMEIMMMMMMIMMIMINFVTCRTRFASSRSKIAAMLFLSRYL